MSESVSIRVTMKKIVVYLSLVLLVLSCSRKADVARTANTARSVHEKGVAPVVSESSWVAKQGVGWENLRTWVPAVDESLWVAKISDLSSNKMMMSQ